MGVHCTLNEAFHGSARERERERKRGRGREGEGKGERERERDRERETLSTKTNSEENTQTSLWWCPHETGRFHGKIFLELLKEWVFGLLSLCHKTDSSCFAFVAQI